MVNTSNFCCNMMDQLKIACTALILMTIASYSVAQYTSENICTKESCYTCIGYACTKFCSGPGCSDCNENNIQCCQDGTCNLCFGQRCCSNITCNQCVGSCVEACSDDPTCYSTCFNKCSPEPESSRDTARVINYESRHYPFNVTTTINITNTINSTNYIDSFIVANTTGYNNFTLDFNNSTTSDDDDASETLQFKCCNVTHPASCNYYGEFKICHVKKHVECSSICVASHVLIGPGDGQQATISVMVPPYRYIGNYQLIDCDKCFSCGSSSSPEECLKNSECPKSCQQYYTMINNRNRELFVYNRQNQPIINQPRLYGETRDPVTHLATKSLESPRIYQTSNQIHPHQEPVPPRQYIPQVLPLQFSPQVQYTQQNLPLQYPPEYDRNSYQNVGQNEYRYAQNYYPASQQNTQFFRTQDEALYPLYSHENDLNTHSRLKSVRRTSVDTRPKKNRKQPRRYNVVQDQDGKFPIYNVVPRN